MMHDLHHEVLAKYAYIRQARTIRYLEDIISRTYRGERLSYNRMLCEAIDLLRDLKFELSNYFDTLMQSILHNIESILDDRYLLKRYIRTPEEKLSANGLEIRKNYRKLIALRDEFLAIQKSRKSSVAE